MLTTRIEEEVRAALDRDPRLTHPELISVTADEIGTVVLRGAVENPLQHRAAVHDAREVEGVFDVIADELGVHPPLGHHPADDQIRAAALNQLASDPRIHAEHVHVRVWHGHLTLKGHVRRESERSAAVEDVQDLSGVVEITNRIEIR